MRFKIFAGILDVDLGELTRRDAEARARRARKLAMLSGAVIVVLIGLLAVAIVNRNRAVEARDESRRQGNISLARALAGEAPRLQGQEKLDEVAALMARQAFLVCRVVGRNLTEDEWKRYVGKDVSYERTCSSSFGTTTQTPVKR